MDSASNAIRQCTTPGCRTITRSSRYSIKDHPGTSVRLGGGVCVNCFKPKPMFCTNEDCKHPIRSSAVPAHLAPGTRLRRGYEGLCEPCFTAGQERPKAKAEPVCAATPEQVEQTKRGLESFLTRRRERLERYAA